MTEQPHWGFIINPIAGDGFAGQYTDVVKQQIASRKLDATIRFTERREHARELSAALAREGCTHIVAVGGDGTINEAASGILNLDHIVFGAVSAGTGNDFIQILGFPERFTDSEWDILFEQNTILMDVGLCNEQVFLNGMGLGFDAKVASENYSIDETVERVGGSNYLWHILKNLFFYREAAYTFRRGDITETSRIFMHTVAIGRRFAGGYYLTPRAIADDGLFDVCAVEPLSLVRRLKLFLQVPKGKHISDKKVRYYQADSLSITCHQTVPFHLDGELFFAQQFEMSILPKKLRMIFNPYAAHYFASSSGKG